MSPLGHPASYGRAKATAPFPKLPMCSSSFLSLSMSVVRPLSLSLSLSLPCLISSVPGRTMCLRHIWSAVTSSTRCKGWHTIFVCRRSWHWTNLVFWRQRQVYITYCWIHILLVITTTISTSQLVLLPHSVTYLDTDAVL